MRSKFEETIRDQLKKSKIQFKYESKTFSYTLKKKYKIDFEIDLGKESCYFLETKGFFSSADRTKLKKVKEEHPDIDLRILFMQDNWMTKTKTQRYSDWATKNGFKWAIGRIPDDWLVKKNSRKRSAKSR